MAQSTQVNNTPFILTGQYFLPNAKQSDLIENGGLAILGDTIIATGTSQELKEKYPGAKHMHEDFGLIMPGLINTHTHAPMSCFRGFADDLPLMTWLQEHIFPVEAQLTAEMVYDSALLSIAEMIKTGTTSFCDMYLFSKEVAKATENSGMRGWIGEVLYDFPSPNYGDLENGFVYMQEMFNTYKSHPRISITTDPHSVYTCSPDLLKRMGAFAKEHDSLFVIHLSENDAEVETCKKQHGVTPVEHLSKLGLLTENTLAAHCVKLSENDIQLLASNNVKVSHCIESNMKLASGIAPIPEILDAGITLSIGTDGSASNNDVDMFGEMNSVAKVHKVTHLDPTVVSAEQTLHAATLGGAEALGAENHIGSLVTGKKADCIVLDLNQPHLTPIYNIPSHLVYVARGADVIHSVIDGQFVMKNRELLTIDETAILNRMTEMGKEIKEMRKQSMEK